jgi:hypothetical protein
VLPYDTPPVVDRPTDLWLERDSAKDQAIVFIFIFATVGLLIYAGLKPWIDRSVDVRWRSVIFAQRD